MYISLLLWLKRGSTNIACYGRVKEKSDLLLNYAPRRDSRQLGEGNPWLGSLGQAKDFLPRFLLSQYALDSRSLGFPGSLYEATLQYHVEFTRPGSGAGNHPHGLPA